GYRVILGAANRSPARERAVIETLLENRPDGLILVGSELPVATIARFAAHVPTVLMGRIASRSSFDCIAIDDRRGAELLVEHLAGLGHTRIVHVDGGRGSGAGLRRSGYQRTMTRLGLGEEVDVLPGEFTEEAGAAAARVLLKRRRRPTAVFAADDLMAIGMLEA